MALEIAMDNRLSKIKENIINKKYSLRCIGVGIILFAILYLLTVIFDCSLCVLKNICGINCFGCGMTRAFICILHFDFLSATEYNTLSVPMFIGIVIYMFVFVLDIILGKNNIKKVERFLSKKYMYFVYLMILGISLYLNNL